MNSRDFENCENDWLAREVARERFAGMFHTDEAERRLDADRANAATIEHLARCLEDAVARRLARRRFDYRRCNVQCGIHHHGSHACSY